MSDDATAAREAFEVWWQTAFGVSESRGVCLLAWLAAWNNRSIPAAAAPAGVYDMMRAYGHDQAYAELVAKDVEAWSSIEWDNAQAVKIAAAAALLREAGWTVEEPKCETCEGSGENETNSAECPTCNGTGRREVGDDNR
jgi:hypothetical protein